jgi:hypothetical protein
MYITTLIFGLSALYLLTYGVGSAATATAPPSYPIELGGDGASTGTKQETYYQRNTVDGNMITSVMKGATNSEQSVSDDDLLE